MGNPAEILRSVPALPGNYEFTHVGNRMKVILAFIELQQKILAREPEPWGGAGGASGFSEKLWQSLERGVCSALGVRRFICGGGGGGGGGRYVFVLQNVLFCSPGNRKPSVAGKTRALQHFFGIDW